MTTPQLPTPIPMGRPRTRLDSGQYIVKIAGIVEYRTYGSANVARQNAKKYKREFKWDGPVFNYRYLVQPIYKVDHDTGELKDVSSKPLSVTVPFCIGDGKSFLLTHLSEKFGWIDNEEGYNQSLLVGYYLKLDVTKDSNAEKFDLLNAIVVQDISVPPHISAMDIRWNEDDDQDTPLESVIPSRQVVQTIKNNQNLAKTIQQEILNANQ